LLFCFDERFIIEEKLFIRKKEKPHYSAEIKSPSFGGVWAGCLSSNLFFSAYFSATFSFKKINNEKLGFIWVANFISGGSTICQRPNSR
jgi:hypothetical protein